MDYKAMFGLLPSKYFVLNINISDEVPEYVREKYQEAVEKNNSVFRSTDTLEESLSMFDAGFDLYNVEEDIVNSGVISKKINHKINCSMVFVNEKRKVHCGYFLYPRSSMGSKTPLRLSNSVGVMDSGYRGDVIACVDNISNDSYSIKNGDRLVQICSPNIVYPTIVNIVNSKSDLDDLEVGKNIVNKRGTGGFGSTGS